MSIFEPQTHEHELTKKRWNRSNKASFEEFLADAVKKPHGQINEQDNHKFRFWFIIAVCVLFAVLTARISYLQIARGAYYTELADKNRIGIEYISPVRGIIYDRYGEALVTNTPIFNLAVIPNLLPNAEFASSEFDEFITKVKQYFKIDQEVLTKIRTLSTKTDRDPVVLQRDISRESVLIYRATEQIDGLAILESANRKYFNGEILGQTIGYIGALTAEEWDKIDEREYSFNDSIGKTGLEQYYEDILRGKRGQKLVERDNRGNIISTIAEQPAQAGKNLILTIDNGLQRKLTEILQKYLDQARVTKGAAVIIDPNNGEVLALVSLPNYDVNIFMNDANKKERQAVLLNKDQPLFHRVVAGTYPPGSTFKPTVAAAALSHGNVNTGTTIYDTGQIEVGGSIFRGWKPGGHGVTNVYRAIAQSVNGYFYAISGGYEETKGMGIEVMAEYARKFGYGSKTGLDLFNEASGLMPDPAWKRDNKNEEWYIGDTYNASIGQGFVLATPLQVAQATAVIANGGTFYQPHLVKKYYQTGSQIADIVVPQKIRTSVASNAAIQAVREGMRQAVTLGTARLLNNLPVTAAGKTGTAQAYNNNKEHAWFTAYAPYDRPEIALAVILEKGGEGSQYAAPVAHEIMYYYFTRPTPTNKDIK